MATRFFGPNAATNLIAARDLIDASMRWSSTPEGEGYWEGVSEHLKARAAEAAAGASPVATPAREAPEELDPIDEMLAQLEQKHRE